MFVIKMFVDDDTFRVNAETEGSKLKTWLCVQVIKETTSLTCD